MFSVTLVSGFGDIFAINFEIYICIIGEGVLQCLSTKLLDKYKISY